MRIASLLRPALSAHRRAPGASALLMALMISACDGGEAKKPKPGEAETEAAQGGEANPAGAEANGPAVKTPTLAEVIAKLSAAADQANAAEAAELAKQIKASGPDAKVIAALHKDGALRFFGRNGQPNSDAQALLALLAELERHGIDKAGYRLAQLDQATAAVPASLQAERGVLLTMTRQPLAAVVGGAAALWLRGGEGGAVQLSRAGAEKLGPAGLQALDRAVPELAQAATKARLAVLAADVELTRAALRYAIDQQMATPMHPVKAQTPQDIKKLADKNAEALQKILGEAPGRLGDALKALWPTHPQYAKLLEASERYQQLVTAGGWQPLPKIIDKTIKKGAVSPANLEFIKALRTRLRTEGYDVSDGELFDDELETAVKAFQGRHQLDPDGVVTKTVINEADVPADKRLRQIRLSLQRYRESEARDPGTGFYIFVNIAFQTLWAMDGGEPIAKHRVIVGNNDSDTDQLTMMKGKINRTKLFSHKMSRVILAPKWFPTQRVVELELQPKLAKDPSFLEKEGYVREVQPDGTEVWYQKAGKANLLGDVKFQGPNKFNIYLHDTPFRALFGKARRPFSHGCVRVDKPLDLAELVLGRDQNMSPKAIRDIIKEKEEKEIRLKTQIPVHIDYASAGVDEDGNAIFGYDVYGYDAAAYEGALPVEEAKEFKAGSTRGL